MCEAAIRQATEWRVRLAGGVLLFFVAVFLLSAFPLLFLPLVLIAAYLVYTAFRSLEWCVAGDGVVLGGKKINAARVRGVEVRLIRAPLECPRPGAWLLLDGGGRVPLSPMFSRPLELAEGLAARWPVAGDLRAWALYAELQQGDALLGMATAVGLAVAVAQVLLAGYLAALFTGLFFFLLDRWVGCRTYRRWRAAYAKPL